GGGGPAGQRQPGADAISVGRSVHDNLANTNPRQIPCLKQGAMEGLTDFQLAMASLHLLSNHTYLWQQSADFKRVTTFFTRRWWMENCFACTGTFSGRPRSTRSPRRSKV